MHDLNPKAGLTFSAGSLLRRNQLAALLPQLPLALTLGLIGVLDILDGLKLAGIGHARMVIAAREDDSENAFIVLAIKETNPKVPGLAVASSAVSLRRLKLAHADMVFSPAAVGSRLLADLVQGNQILPQFGDLLEGHIKNPA